MAGGEVYVLTRFDSHGVTDTIGVFGGLQAAKDWHHVEGWRPCRYDRWDAVQGECVYEIQRCEVKGESE